MKYIAVQFFGEWDKKYTYECKSRRIKRNDFVIVPTPTGNTVAKVMNDNLSKPSFQCKQVIKKVEL